jgi:hypothetical protein
MSLIAVPPANPSEADIDCGGFFPPISPAAAREAMRIDGSVSPTRLRKELSFSALSVMNETLQWALDKINAGANSLADLPGPEIDGQRAAVHYWFRAVYSLTSASLTEYLRDYDSTNDGHQQADKLAATIDEHRRDARWAISGLLGIGRSTVELI